MDVLAALYQRELLLADIILEPERVQRQLDKVLEWRGELVRENIALLRQYQDHFSSWVPLVNTLPWDTLLSELSAMVSAASFATVSLPALKREAADFPQLLYNLDGDSYARLLPEVLQIPGLHGIDWSPTRKFVHPTKSWKDFTDPWVLEVARDIQEHVKLVLNGIASWQVDEVMRQISADGTFLLVDCASEAEAREFLDHARRWIR
jgi:hypothetical protein